MLTPTPLRISDESLNELTEQASASARLRAFRNLHRTYEDPCQRLLNSIGLSSYIRPHRHQAASTTETLVALRGIFGILTFSEHGDIHERLLLSSERHSAPDTLMLAEIPPDTWHTVIALIPGSVLFETKAGPFKSDLAKEFAPWAPKENTQEAKAYLSALTSEFSLAQRRHDKHSS